MKRGLILLLLLLAHTGAAMGAGQAPFGIDLDGRVLSTLAWPGGRVVVLFFVASDCSVSNRYLPEIERLEKEFGDRQAHFWLVYSNPEETVAGIRRHQADFGTTIPALRDPEQSLARLAGAKITPEAAVFAEDDAGLRQVYRGRIDDRYVSLGYQRPEAFHHDVEDAIAAVLAGRSVAEAEAQPVGCPIVQKQ